jgi:hypothetical protein
MAAAAVTRRDCGALRAARVKDMAIIASRMESNQSFDYDLQNDVLRPLKVLSSRPAGKRPL